MSRIILPNAGPWVNDTSTAAENPGAENSAVENAAARMVQSIVDGVIVDVRDMANPADEADQNGAQRMVQSMVDGHIVMVLNTSPSVAPRPGIFPTPPAFGTAFHPFESMPVEGSLPLPLAIHTLTRTNTTKLQRIVWHSSSAPGRDMTPRDTNLWRSISLLGDSDSKRLTHHTAYKRLLCIGDRWGLRDRNMLLGVSRCSRIIALEEYKKTVQAMPVDEADQKGMKEKMGVKEHLG